MTLLHRSLLKAWFALEPGGGITLMRCDHVVQSCKWEVIMLDEATNVMMFQPPAVILLAIFYVSLASIQGFGEDVRQLRRLSGGPLVLLRLSQRLIVGLPHRHGGSRVSGKAKGEDMQPTRAIELSIPPTCCQLILLLISFLSYQDTSQKSSFI